jgi:phytoene dehydrogenase-like protein
MRLSSPVTEDTIMAETGKFDVVVIGAGHNGLVAANYLARAGKSVCVVEARPVVGGACVTEELVPGSRWSSCSFVQGMLRPEIIADLDLASHGLTSIAPDPQGLGLWSDGDHVMLHQDVDATLKSIEAHSPPDGRGFFEFGARLKRFADLTRDWLLSDPPERSEVFARFEAAGETELLDEFLLLSAQDLLDRYITSDRLKGYMMFLGMVSIWGGPHTPTTAWVYGYHACGEFEGAFGRWALPVGGMGSITQALKRGAEAHGAVVRTGTPVEEILVTSGRARGVRLAGGETVHADIVLSNTVPGRTFGRLLPKGALAPAAAAAAERLDTRGSMARMHILVDELPHWVGFEPGPGPQHRAHAILNATPQLYQDAHEAQIRGEFPDDFVIEALIHSATDPSVCKPGHHTLALGVQQLPLHLRKGTWDDHKEAWLDRVMETLYRFAPNLRGHVIGRNVISPLDLERTYGLTGGNIFQGSIVGLENLFSARGAPAESYRTPVEGLYLCGAGVHPGGGVTGAPGHNAAKRVLADLAGNTEPLRRHTELSKSLVDQMLETGYGKEIGYRVARSKALRSATRFFSKVKK